MPRPSVLLDFAELVQERSIAGAAEVLGVSVRQARQWYEHGFSDAAARWLNDRLPRLHRGAWIYRVRVPSVTWRLLTGGAA
jgi:hypothetical protein